jgi:hypothetical protein
MLHPSFLLAASSLLDDADASLSPGEEIDNFLHYNVHTQRKGSHEGGRSHVIDKPQRKGGRPLILQRNKLEGVYVYVLSLRVRMAKHDWIPGPQKKKKCMNIFFALLVTPTTPLRSPKQKLFTSMFGARNAMV